MSGPQSKRKFYTAGFRLPARVFVFVFYRRSWQFPTFCVFLIERTGFFARRFLRRFASSSVLFGLPGLFWSVFVVESAILSAIMAVITSKRRLRDWIVAVLGNCKISSVFAGNFPSPSDLLSLATGIYPATGYSLTKRPPLGNSTLDFATS